MDFHSQRFEIHLWIHFCTFSQVLKYCKYSFCFIFSDMTKNERKIIVKAQSHVFRTVHRWIVKSILVSRNCGWNRYHYQWTILCSLVGKSLRNDTPIHAPPQPTGTANIVSWIQSCCFKQTIAVATSLIFNPVSGLSLNLIPVKIK